MLNSISYRARLGSLFTPSRRMGIASGTWGRIIEGRGWHETEYHGEQPFRWAESGAAIEIAPSSSTWPSLDMDIEPGPSLKGAALEVEVCNAAGECVDRIDVRGRQVAHIILPGHPANATSFTLRVRGDVRPVPGDSRQLCFRLFSIRESAPLLSAGLRFESGWHAYETANGTPFRWASNRAAIRVQAARACPTLTADLEPGPGTQQRPFRIDLVTPEGARVFTTAIRTREQIQIRLPLKSGELGVFHISADESMVTAARGDSRDLIFRTFGMAIS